MMGDITPQEVYDNYSFEINGIAFADYVQCFQCNYVVNVMTEFYKMEEHFNKHRDCKDWSKC